ALPLAVLALALEPAVGLAQTGGGSTGGASGSGSSAGSGSGSAGGTTTGPSSTGPAPRAPATGPQSRSPALPPSTVPQRDTGVPPVPSAGNAEPSSPIYRRDTPPGSLTPQR